MLPSEKLFQPLGKGAPASGPRKEHRKVRRPLKLFALLTRGRLNVGGGGGEAFGCIGGKKKTNALAGKSGEGGREGGGGGLFA